MTCGQRVVVVGGGMAAARLAQQLDRADVDLTVVGEEPHAPYNRVLLADVLAGRYAPEVTALPTTHARWLRGVRAVRVDRGERRVVCAGARRPGHQEHPEDPGHPGHPGHLEYDALVLATGANPVLPPLRGLFTASDRELPHGVRAFRTLDDCLALRAEAAAHPGTHAVVIGGGLLGVSAARALALCGARVVLAHQGGHLMERQLDPEASELLRLHLRELGVETHTECRVRGLRTEGGPSNRAVRAVELADGYVLEAGLAVLACGVRPSAGLARAAGLDVARGVVVDDQLRTSDPRVYAIGDCAEHGGVLYGRAGPAQEQADALARVLLGSTRAAPRPRYPGTRTLTRLTLAARAPIQAQPRTTGEAPGPEGTPGTDSGTAPGTDSSPGKAPDTGAPRRLPLDLAAFGDPTPRPEDDVVRLSDATRGLYRKVVVRGDRLVGGILLGDLGAVGPLARAWEGDEELPSAPLLHLLTQPPAQSPEAPTTKDGMR